MADDCIILIDTNLVLHYQRIDQVDWPTIAGCPRCTLAITPVLMRELDHHKVLSRSRALRDRASKMIDYLITKIDEPNPIKVRRGVTMTFVTEEPAIDFAAHKLKESIADDQFIAAALDLASSTSAAVLIASADGGMALKLRSRPIRILRLPDTLKLPEEPDPLEKELRDTRHELQKMQARQPQLAVRFADGSTLLRLLKRAPGPPPGIKTPAEMRRKYPKKMAPKPLPTDPLSASIVRTSSFDIGKLVGGGFAGKIDHENVHIDLYYLKYDHYYKEISSRHDWLQRSYEIELKLINDGSGPATIMEAQLAFPGPITVGRLSDAPEMPDAPDPPKLKDRFASDLSGIAQISHLRIPPMLEFHEGRPLFDDEGGNVFFETSNLRPKSQFALDTFVITFAALADCRPIEVAVTIRCNELEPITQTLAIVFEEPAPATS
jgi:hypothetical protein